MSPYVRNWTAATALVGALLATNGLGADAGSASPVERGRAHIEATCQRCHPGAQLDALVRRKVGDRPLPDALDGFLAEHHAADPALRAGVIAALERRLAGEDGS